MTSESQERMLAIVTPEGLDEVLDLCARWEVRATVIGRVTRGRVRPGRAAAHPRRVRRRGARRRARGQPPRGRPALRPAARRRPTRLGAARRRSPAAGPPPASRAARPAVRHARGSGAVRPPAVPQHRGGPGRRRRAAAPQAPGHRGRHRPRAWPSPPTATTAGARVDPRAGTALVVAEAVLNLACVGARPIAVVELPQLRQPRAPRGDVAAVRGHRRHGRGLPRLRPAGHRRQRQPLQRDRRAPTSTRRRSSACSGWSTGSTAARRASVLVAGDRRAARSGRCRRAASLGGSAVGLAPGAPGRGRCPPSTRAAHTAVAALVRGLVGDGVVSGVHDVATGGAAVALAEMAVAHRASGAQVAYADAAELFCEAPSRVAAVGARRPRWREVRAPSRARSASRSPTSARPVATGSSVDGAARRRARRGGRRLARPPAGRARRRRHPGLRPRRAGARWIEGHAGSGDGGTAGWACDHGVREQPPR